MDNNEKIKLLKEISICTSLLKKHQALKREEQLKLLNQQSCQKPGLKRDNMVKNQAVTASSFNQKYSFKRSDHNVTSYYNKRTVLYNDQNYKSKYVLSKNQPMSSMSKNFAKVNISNSNTTSSQHKSILNSETKFVNIPCKSTKQFGKLSATNLMKDIDSVSEMLKKKISGNKPELSNSVAKDGNEPKNQLSIEKKYSTLSSFKLTKNEKVTCKNENPAELIQKANHVGATYTVNNKQSYARVNSKGISPGNVCQQVGVNPNKFTFRKDADKKSLNTNSIATPLKVVMDDNLRTKSQNPILGSDSLEVIPSGSKTASVTSCSSVNISEFVSKSLPAQDQMLQMKLNATSKLSLSTKHKESPNKVQPANLWKSLKVMNVKHAGTRYKKINKNLTVPKGFEQLKYSNHSKMTPVKKTKKVNTKYKVINKTLTPVIDKRKINTGSYSAYKRNSASSIDSNDFLMNSNESAIDKLEKKLLAESEALTATPLLKKSELNYKKMFYSNNNVTPARFRKTPQGKSKTTRVSKYKIVNSHISQKSMIKKNENLMSPKLGVKRVKNSKFSLVNKHIQPGHAITPVRKDYVLVKRLFKSKNAIVNKNATPSSYSAKMIKSKYMALQNRKSPRRQQQYLHPRILPYPKFQGYLSRAKVHSKLYQKPSFHSQIARQFMGYRNFNSRIRNRIIGKNYRHVHAPVVMIRGLKYSVNSSGKTLKKLPFKGQTSKVFQRSIYTKTFTPATNLANRVLHRSISRILSASSRKNLSKVNTYCMFYNRFGRCNRGVKCTYIHDPSKIAVCTRFLRGTCKIDGCPFSHVVDPGKMAICSFFLVGECRRENCPYRHEKLSSDAELCKDFVQGYCRFGKECKKAHILICPKYMQGECDKGSSCAYPHPPQKKKKQIQKDVENEVAKPADALLDKVFRYFQEGGDSALNSGSELSAENTNNVCVPKQRIKLEVQPSFIPL